METPTREALLASPCTSFWLKDALNKLAERDVLDALHDAHLLYLVQQAEWNKAKLEAA